MKSPREATVYKRSTLFYSRIIGRTFQVDTQSLTAGIMPFSIASKSDLVINDGKLAPYVYEHVIHFDITLRVNVIRHDTHFGRSLSWNRDTCWLLVLLFLEWTKPLALLIPNTRTHVDQVGLPSFIIFSTAYTWVVYSKYMF